MRSIACWIRNDAATAFRQILDKAPTTGTVPGLILDAAGGDLVYREDFPTFGEWTGASSIGLGAAHVACVYDAGSTANVPTMYVNGQTISVTTTNTPVGTQNSDANGTLLSGESSNGFNDFDGRIGHLCYDNTLWDAAMVNRHYWWGCAPGGPSTVKVWQPMWTEDLNNRGTATANGTATGTSVENSTVPRVERCWGSMMGCGR